MFAYDTNMLARKWASKINLVESVKGEKLTPEKKHALCHALTSSACKTSLIAGNSSRGDYEWTISS